MLPREPGSSLAAAWHSPALRRSMGCSTSANNAPYKQRGSAPWRKATRGFSRQNSESFLLRLGDFRLRALLSSCARQPWGKWACACQLSLHGTPQHARAQGCQRGSKRLELSKAQAAGKLWGLIWLGKQGRNDFFLFLFFFLSLYSRELWLHGIGFYSSFQMLDILSNLTCGF